VVRVPVLKLGQVGGLVDTVEISVVEVACRAALEIIGVVGNAFGDDPVKGLSFTAAGEENILDVVLFFGVKNTEFDGLCLVAAVVGGIDALGRDDPGAKAGVVLMLGKGLEGGDELLVGDNEQVIGVVR
jgi:hypothetical protein